MRSIHINPQSRCTDAFHHLCPSHLILQIQNPTVVLTPGCRITFSEIPDSLDGFDKGVDANTLLHNLQDYIDCLCISLRCQSHTDLFTFTFRCKLVSIDVSCFPLLLFIGQLHWACMVLQKCGRSFICCSITAGMSSVMIQWQLICRIISLYMMPVNNSQCISWVLQAYLQEGVIQVLFVLLL